MSHFKVTFPFQLHIPVFMGKSGVVAQFTSGIQPNDCSVFHYDTATRSHRHFDCLHGIKSRMIQRQIAQIITCSQQQHTGKNSRSDPDKTQ